MFQRMPTLGSGGGGSEPIFDGIIYENGAFLVGGTWGKYNYNYSTYSTTEGKITSENLTVIGVSNGANILGTKEKIYIDTSKFSKLYIKVDSIALSGGSAGNMIISPTQPNIDASSNKLLIASAGNSYISLAGVPSGEYYIAICSTNNASRKVVASKIWLE